MFPPVQPPAHRNATGRGFDVAAKEVELEGITFHSLRHLSASRMIDRGIASTLLAKLRGRESYAISARLSDGVKRR